MISRRKKPARKPTDGAEGALRAAMSLLAYKDNTESELRRKLSDRGYEEEEIDGAFSVLRAKRYLDEKRYFLRFVQNCAGSRRFGARRILNEARVKGFSDETIAQTGEEALAPFDFNELCLETARKLSLPSTEKLAAALLRRGYSGENVRYALSLLEKN